MSQEAERWLEEKDSLEWNEELTDQGLVIL